MGIAPLTPEQRNDEKVAEFARLLECLGVRHHRLQLRSVGWALLARTQGR